ncbi:hypothetical protein KUCAC02_037733, partial [Chaenocephalus aceratus]
MDSKTKKRRLRLAKSSSLPSSSSLAPRLTPLSLMPRPHTVVSTLHLEVFNDPPSSSHLVFRQQ